MSNEKKTEHAPETEKASQSEDPFAMSGAEQRAEQTGDTGQDMSENKDSAAEVRASEAGSSEEYIRDLEERLQRAIAEQENVRKRMEREKADGEKYAIANFAREVLGIADNIQRAIDAVPKDAAEKDTALKTFLDGIEVTERELHKAMERHGIAKMSPEGEKFDPNFHQAMFEVPTPDKPSGVVMQVVQPGYTLGDRLLRPAMVGVSKAAPAASGANENNPQAGGQGAQNGAAKNAGKDSGEEEPAGEARPEGAATPKEQPASAAAQASATPEPEKADPATNQPRGSSRLNEPVINTETEQSFGTEEAARRKN